MTTALPAWADTPEGRDLVAAIEHERPSYRTTRGTWIEGGGNVRYQGRTAARLRKLYDAAFDVQMDAYSAGKSREAVLADLGMSADQLISSILGEHPVADWPIAPARHVLTDRIVRAA